MPEDAPRNPDRAYLWHIGFSVVVILLCGYFLGIIAFIGFILASKWINVINIIIVMLCHCQPM